MGTEIAISLFRFAERFPPGDKEYLSSQAKGRIPPSNASDELLRSWDALSGWDTLEAARQKAPLARSAKWIVRYDIPADSGVEFEPSIEPGHYDIRGDIEQLKRYLAMDFKEEVQRRRPD